MENNALQNRIDFSLLVTVDHANPNGDPENGNHPRQDMDGYGEISDVAIKRKIRNRLDDLGENILVLSMDRTEPDQNNIFSRLSANQAFKDVLTNNTDGKQDAPEQLIQRAACDNWIDVRAFGQVLPVPKDKTETKKLGLDPALNLLQSTQVRGAVTVRTAFSVDPIVIEDMQITKSISNKHDPAKSSSRGSDTMGRKAVVTFGLYQIKGSINPFLAEKNGLSQKDIEQIKLALCTLFENDESSARPAGSMDIIRFDWWQQGNANDQRDHAVVSVAKVHKYVNAKLKNGIETPRSIDDYQIADSTPSWMRHEVY